VVAEIVNAVNRSALGRTVLDKALGVHPDAPVPRYHSRTYRKRHAAAHPVSAGGEAGGRVVLFATCYGNRNQPELGEDLAAIFEHNGIAVTIAAQERCCGMPKLEIGDLEAVAALKDYNLPQLARLVEQGWDIVTPIPSCTLMFKQELPLLFAQDEQVRRVRDATFDPFEYLWARHKAGLLRTDFSRPLGKIAYHVPCHLRVQNLGLRTRDVLSLIPGTQVEPVERCSGHNGTYGVKREYREISMKIGRPVVRRIADSDAGFYASDCPMAGHQIASGLVRAGKAGPAPEGPIHPLKLLRLAYGI
jgi:Fe-S oxidoreductase